MRRPDLAIALDLPSPAAALALVDRLGDEVTWYKVGPVLGTAAGPDLVRELVGRGKSVFLDYKWHDIPNTAAGAVAAAASLGAALATVHLSGGRAMLEAAASARGGKLRLVGVGVLTSLDGAGFGVVMGREVSDVGWEQERLMQPGLGLLDGFVTAPGETARIRGFAGPDAFLVTPGIRLSGGEGGDHRRSATPGEAVQAGTDLLVVGRPITEARDPAAVVQAIRIELQPRAQTGGSRPVA
ncbi:MAG TPA: orotidine-5'-phosphate decarboxylase [Gemmatimonadales bacterium]|jgi:orotidine-5'-phosphate decarboxylase